MAGWAGRGIGAWGGGHRAQGTAQRGRCRGLEAGGQRPAVACWRRCSMCVGCACARLHVCMCPVQSGAGRGIGGRGTGARGGGEGTVCAARTLPCRIRCPARTWPRPQRPRWSSLAEAQWGGGWGVTSHHKPHCHPASWPHGPAFRRMLIPLIPAPLNRSPPPQKASRRAHAACVDAHAPPACSRLPVACGHLTVPCEKVAASRLDVPVGGVSVDHSVRVDS